MVPQISSHSQRKRALVALGLWGLATGRGWLVQAIDTALAREDLRGA
jgi:hypothetical protein